jgi:hypothetical protein
VLDALEALYGKQSPFAPTDPFEFLVSVFSLPARAAMRVWESPHGQIE